MSSNALSAYLNSVDQKELNSAFVAYLASLSSVAEVSPETAADIVRELADQRSNLKLIASENYCSLATQLAMGNLLTDKYAEGYPHHRFYAGCDNVDNIEARACEQACKLFGAEHAYVQPHSGADANLIAYWAILHTKVTTPALEEYKHKKLTDFNREEWIELRHRLGNQRLFGQDYYSGGHLTHGYQYNVSAQMFDAHTYGVNKETDLLDYDEIETRALEIKPLILLAGYSAYSRKVNFKRMREIADKVGAVLMVDMAHFAGLVAGDVFKGDYDPILHADVVTTTTHKTLRGPRGGLVLCKQEFAEQVDKGCPLVIGGPLPHVMAAKEICLREANESEFKEYAKEIVVNAQALAEAFIDEDMEVLSGGTDNHLMLVNVTPFGLNGRQAESAIRECGITLNRNSLPYDSNGAWYTSGLRLGTPAITTLGMGKEEMKEIASVIKVILADTEPAVIQSGKNTGSLSKSKIRITEEVRKGARDRVVALLKNYPVYPELDLPLLQKFFLKD